ncbi:unnamed protein product (macronuclear) [Paramecium tetraurelia]|uniref:CDT1 Geminin-binding domain-containing protein n=1 Tax=Paramecium tetraurelia TaxID=5888 RepID=A0BZD5_PARTE|nr:uncharacterized protein GSPATT00033755001 [Paramecium tetraurelia]CAK63902.1 unnamed protein product [Paramecium tetraurelia]|eukprot:XP_001431300.1 hypothetical protein (macronuclear) [Paramecium tetraurelia strain d4-2]
MIAKCFSVLKQQKSEQKQRLIVNNQISNQELESLQPIHTLLSPLCGNSQCSTENSSSIKLQEKMIEELLLDEQFELIFSDIDNAEYYRQTLVFKTIQELKQAIPRIKRSFDGLVMPINEMQIDKQLDESYKLRIITKKFIHHNFTINIRALCRFIEKIIEFDLAFQSSDIIQYHDESIHINPISLVRCSDQKQTCYESLKELLSSQFDFCSNIQLILEILKDFENQDLAKLSRYHVTDKDIYRLKLQLTSKIYKRTQI